jgi:hypothetical protein
LRVAISLCEPVASGSLSQGNSGDGYGNTAADRTMEVFPVYFTADAGDDPQEAADLIERIELCTLDGSGNESCPGTDPWLVYDKAAGIGSISLDDIYDGPKAAKGVKSVRIAGLPLDWADPALAGTGLFLDDLAVALRKAGQKLPANANTHKYLDCAVFNWLYRLAAEANQPVDSCRAVFVPLKQGQGMPRLWTRSGIFGGAHVQLCVREPSNILAVWPVKKDGRYGQDR